MGIIKDGRRREDPTHPEQIEPTEAGQELASEEPVEDSDDVEA